MRYIWTLAIFVGMVSCGGGAMPEEPTPPPPASTISLDKPTMAVASGAASFTIRVASNAKWTVSGANSWCRVSVSEGVGNGEVEVTVLENDKYDERKVSLTFASGEVVTKANSANVIITQAEKGGLFIGSSDTLLTRHGGSIDVQLLANVEYDYVIEHSDWIQPAQASKALVPSSRGFVVLKNEGTAVRSSKLIFKDKNSSVSDTMVISQRPSGELQLASGDNWDGVRRADIFYQVFVRSFADSDGDGIGDLRGVQAKLDYIVSLGCTGIWLTPINPSPSYHGYDVTDYKGVNSDFGTMADFDALVAAANVKGVKIVLDFVINHSSNQHPWFLKADSDEGSAERQFYMMYPSGTDIKSMCEGGQISMIEDKRYNSGMWRNSAKSNRYYAMFDGSMPDLNYGVVGALNPIYDSIVEAAEFWMARGASGLRLDAVKHIYQDENSSENWQFLDKFYKDLRGKYPNIYMVGEVLSGIDLTAKYFAGLPSLFHFDSWWKLEGALGNSQGRYYARDMVDAISKFKAVRSDFNACTKLSNHDEDRAMSKLGGSLDKAKLAFATIMTTPGQPYIYYGEELGMAGMKSTGDENVREPLKWGDKYTTSWTAIRNNVNLADVSAQSADKSSLLSFYRAMSEVRNTYEVLSNGELKYPDPATLPNELMVYTRENGSQKIMVISNVSGKMLDYEFTSDAKRLLMSHNGAQLLKYKYESGYIAEMPAYSMLLIEM